MKMIFAVLALIACQNALAYPTLGDTAEFKDVNGTILTLKNNGYDTVSHVWNVEVSQNGQVTGIEKFTDDDMPTSKDIASLLGQCAQSAGTKETLNVPAGSFESCKFANEGGGFTWLADVPFAMVKVVTSEVNMELTSFTAAK